MAHFITVTVSKISEDEATLVFEDGMEVSWPTSQLPEGSKEGDQLHLLGRNEHAKELLNELLKEDSTQ